MKIGDQVRIKPQYSRYQYNDLEEWKLFDEPYNPHKGFISYTCTFTECQFGTVLGFTVKYDLVHRIESMDAIELDAIEHMDVKVLVGDQVGWIDGSILCKVGE